VTEAACPFCGTVLADADARVVPDATRRLTRVAFMVGAAVNVASCGGVALYGAPSPGEGGSGGDGDEGGAAGQGGDDPAGAGGAVALYGAPAVGGSNAGGQDGAGGAGNHGAGDEGGFVAEYGAPPPPDP
jgi:hypothetical protein